MTSAVLPDMSEVAPPMFDKADYASLLEVVRGVLKEEQLARRSEVRDAFRCRSYVDGHQHLIWDANSYTYMYARPGEGMPRYMGVTNRIKLHYRSFVANLSQNAPGINFVPDDLQQPADVTAASYAEKMRSRVDRMVAMRDRQTELAGLFCTDSRAMAWVRLDTAGNLKITLHGTPETKVPLYIREFVRWPYAVISEELDVWQEKDEWSEFADKIQASEGDTGTVSERYARLGLIGETRGGNADSLNNLVTRHTAWIRPSRYRKATDETEKKLQMRCPNGARITVSGDVVVEVVPQAIEEALRVEWCGPGQKNSRPSLLSPGLSIQDTLNEVKNHLREQADYVDPLTVLDGTAFDDEAVEELESSPGGVAVTRSGGSKSMQDVATTLPGTQLDAGLIAMAEQAAKDMEEVLGDLPILQGAGTEDQDTVGVNRLLQAQAKGQLTMPWAAEQRLFAGIYELAIPLVAQQDSERGEVSIQGGNGQESFNPAAILNGKFHCYPDQDSSFPETTADKRASFEHLMTMLAGAPSDSIPMMPDNVKYAVQLSGLKDVKIPAAEARDKALQTIGKLLQEPTLPPTPEMQQQWEMAAQQSQTQGQPPPPPPQNQPSMQPDADWDYAQPELDKFTEWLSSPARFEEERKGNLDGVANVRLYGMALKQIVQLQNQPAPLPPPKVSLTMAVTDATTIANAAQAAGLTQSTPDNVAASQVPEDQKTVAQTQHAAAQAQHVAVLAGKEAVAAPKLHNVVPIQPPPDIAAQEK